MPKIDEIITNYAVYEDATEYLGTSEVTLPEITNLAEEISGAAMTLTLNFRTVTANTIKLAEPRVHKLDLRAAQQEQNTRTGQTEVRSVKHILKVRPKKLAPGKLAAASASDANGEYAVTYYAIYIDGKKKLEIDQLNYIFYVNGKDYLSEVRKALGK